MWSRTAEPNNSIPATNHRYGNTYNTKFKFCGLLGRLRGALPRIKEANIRRCETKENTVSINDKPKDRKAPLIKSLRGKPPARVPFFCGNMSFKKVPII